MEFEGSRGQRQWARNFDQDFAGTSKNVEGSRGKIQRASKNTESSRVLREISQVVEDKSR